ncbi:MAG: DUF2007 domain-containing protein [Lamprobacter sp.]|uniref:putative signal transducing protein n=1 Tax=Lamprobacter sp. TaxID=3100796 RepID=UPI002B25A9DB|nr:DUF2007 domain-containing protein [Lamprobacter sp.]MEA3639277.1 DUF2007 domain-containing protein [Lamprobacter sp.]
MQQLYQAADRIEAQLLLDLLERHNLQARVFGDALSGAIGELVDGSFDLCWRCGREH